MARRCRAVRWGILGRADLRREVDPPVLIQHRVVRVDPRIPHLFGAKVWRRPHHRVGQRRAGGVLIAHRHFHGGLGHLDRVQDRQVIRAQLGRPIDRAEGVDRGFPPVSERQVVEIGLGVGPVVHGHNEIALHAMRSRRHRRRQFASLDAIGPLRQAVQVPPVCRVEGRDSPDHGVTAWSGHQPPRPRLDGAIERAQGGGNLARRLVAELVTVAAAIQLDDVEPLCLALKGHRHAVAVRGRCRETGSCPES